MEQIVKSPKSDITIKIRAAGKNFDVHLSEQELRDAFGKIRGKYGL